MKPKARIRPLLLAAGITITSAHAAPLLPGKKIGVDYGPTLTTNWNNFTANGSKAAGTVVHLDGTVSDLLAMTVSNGGFFNNDGTNNWVGLQSNPTSIAPNPKAPPEFVDSVTTDIGGNVTNPDTPFRLVVTGLNPYLAYKVDAVSTAGSTANTESMTILGDSTYGPTAVSRSSAVSQGRYHSFASVVPTTGGQLTFDMVDSSTNTNPILNGILVEVLAPTAVGLLDNDGDTMPNWWEVAYQFNPESNVDGGSTDTDTDGIPNVDEFAGGSNPRDPLSVPAIPTWAVDGDGTWNTPANWSTASVPNGPNQPARLSSAVLVTASGATIALDVPVTLGLLETIGGKPFKLGAANALTFSATSSNASVITSADAGSSLEILGNVVLASPLEVTSGGTSAVTLGGSLTETTGPHAITKGGLGDLVLSGDASGFAGAIAVNSGQLVLNRPGAFTFDNVLSGAGSLVHAGGGILTMSLGKNHAGGTRVTNAGTLSLDNAAPLGSGALTLDNGTLHATADVSAAAKSLNVGTGGATVEVDNGFLLTTGGSAASSGTVAKTGPGTWRIQGGNGASTGMFTVTAGVLDLNRNDTWGNHSGSTQALTIQSGGLVTNGTAINSGYNTLQSLTLDGGELRVTGTARAIADGPLNKFEAYGIRDTVTVTGTNASLITNPGNIANAGINIGGTTNLGGGVGSSLTFNVADVTNSSDADLTVSAVLKNTYNATPAINPSPVLANGLIKTGSGTMVLSAVNRYTGNTSVDAGTLSLGVDACLADTSNVVIGAGTLAAGTDVNDSVGTLNVTGAATINLASGATLSFADSSAGGTATWEGTLNLIGFVSGSTLNFGSSTGLTAQQLGKISATGFSNFSLDTEGDLIADNTGGSAYDTWSSGAPFGGDANGDGVSNGLAFLLGAATPGANATGLLPTTSQTGGNLVMSFTCLATADRGTSTLTLEYDGDLAGTWLSVPVPGAVGAPNPIVETTTSGSVSFVATDGGTNVNGDALIIVVATISDTTESASGKLFGRVKGTNP